MDRARILVAGVGNIFRGDDAFGVEVAQRLAARPLPPEVRVVDFGIRGLDLTYALLDGWEAVVLVDATPRGGAAGTLYLLQPDLNGSADGPAAIEPHDMDPVKVLRLAAAMGGRVDRLLVVGCEPTPSGDAEEMQMGMSDAARSAVDEAVGLVESLVGKLLGGAAVAGAAGAG